MEGLPESPGPNSLPLKTSFPICLYKAFQEVLGVGMMREV